MSARAGTARGRGGSRWRGVGKAALWSLAGVGAVLAVAAALAFYLVYAPAPRAPASLGRLEAREIHMGGRARSYLLYTPARAGEAPPLLVVFHGSMGSAEGARVATGYQFESLADRHGFLVAYPQGHEGNWNDCRKAADYAARRLRIDDVGFFRLLIARAQTERGVRPDRVFAAGVSSGGHMVFRLALEQPNLLVGAAVFGASLATPANSDCTPAGPPPPMMLVNGTADPISPYEGGTVSMFGLAPRGAVLSARESAAGLAEQAGAVGPDVSRLPRGRDGTSVERAVWKRAGQDAVVLLSVHGGGHAVPQPLYRAPRLLGRVSTALNGPAEAWDFFARAAGLRSRAAQAARVAS